MQNQFTSALGIEVPIICGPMYPCSNPELIAAVSESGAIGVVQPISLTYVHGYDFREGLKYIRSLTSKPIGFNALIEKSSQRYQEKMESWVDIALEEGIRFFITSLGNPKWVVERAHAVGGIVYHDVTERKWADKGLESGADGLIAVNNWAGGHAGARSVEELFRELEDLNVPIVCAGGVGEPRDMKKALDIGYQGVQMGTRFIATEECKASDAYKNAIVQATSKDIVLSEKITGVPVSVINTPFIQRMGLKSSRFVKWLLRGQKTKHWVRTFYALKSIFQLKKSLLDEEGKKEFWQAGKSVAGIHSVETVSNVMNSFKNELN